MKILKGIKIPILYPFLLSIYPVLHIYVTNIQEAELREFLFFAALVLILTLVVYFLGLFIFRKENHKAALFAGVFILLFLSYGHIFDFIAGWKVGIFSNTENKWILDWTFGRHRYLLGFFLILILGISIWLQRAKKDLNNMTKIYSFISIVLLIWPTIQLVNYQLFQKTQWTQEVIESEARTNQKLPDIYYIIPDGHVRADVAKKHFGYDLTPLINKLEDLDFYIARDARSNYTMTNLSIPSFLSMNYLDKYFDVEKMKDIKGRFEAWSLINEHDDLKQEFNKLGYKWISLDSGYKSNMKENTDIFLTNNQSSFEFYNTFLDTTPLQILIKPNSSLSPARIRHNQSLFAFKKLGEIPDIKEPTFTFAHIIAPHPPYVFNKEGNIPPEDIKYLLGKSESRDIPKLKELYIDQMDYVDRKLIETIDTIIRKSDNPPIIVIQADHGFHIDDIHPNDNNPELWNNYTAILSAFYFPDHDYSQLYSTITPVNNFRVVLNQYFDRKIELLEDRSYYSWYGEPFQFQEVD
ncbi:sulfatase-like hydrolase/transferase [Patescibacteria group bacterium]